MCLWYVFAVDLSLCSCLAWVRRATCKSTSRAASEARIPADGSGIDEATCWQCSRLAVVDGSRLAGGNRVAPCHAGGEASHANENEGGSRLGDRLHGGGVMTTSLLVGDMRRRPLSAVSLSSRHGSSASQAMSLLLLLSSLLSRRWCLVSWL